MTKKRNKRNVCGENEEKAAGERHTTGVGMGEHNQQNKGKRAVKHEKEGGGETTTGSWPRPPTATPQAYSTQREINRKPALVFICVVAAVRWLCGFVSFLFFLLAQGRPRGLAVYVLVGGGLRHIFSFDFLPAVIRL